MVRELARYDDDHARRILRWPVREALLAYEDLLKRAAMESYRFEMRIWAAIAPYAKNAKQPEPPRE